MENKNSLSIWLWLIIPVTFSVAHLCLQLFLPHKAMEPLLVENGPYEIEQVFVIMAALLMGIGVLTKTSPRAEPWFFLWVFLGSLACFYIGGEEISWGQQIFHWATPSDWSAINDHHETNLHNTSQWFDEKPKLLLELGIYIGAIFMPLIEKLKPGTLPEKFEKIYPPAILGGIAGCLLVFRILKIFDDELSFTNFVRLSEVKELLVYYFLFLYLAILWKRVKGPAS